MIRFVALAAAFIAPVAALASGPTHTPPAQAQAQPQAPGHAQPQPQPHAWSFNPTQTGLCQTPNLVLSPFIVGSDGKLIPNPIFQQIALGIGAGTQAQHPTTAGSGAPPVDPADNPQGGTQQETSPSQPPANVHAGPQAPHLAPLQPLPPPPPSLTPPHHTWVTQDPNSPGLIFNF